MDLSISDFDDKAILDRFTAVNNSDISGSCNCNETDDYVNEKLLTKMLKRSWCTVSPDRILGEWERICKKGYRPPTYEQYEVHLVKNLFTETYGIVEFAALFLQYDLVLLREDLEGDWGMYLGVAILVTLISTSITTMVMVKCCCMKD